MIGQLFGHYRVLSKIGEGGMGVLYRRTRRNARSRRGPEGGGRTGQRSEVDAEPMLHEARSTSALSHPNICTVHEIGEFAGEAILGEIAVAVVFYIPGPLRDFTEGTGREQVAGTPGRLGDALALLCKRHPGIRDRAMTEQRQIRPHINVFVGTEDVRYTGGLGTRIQKGGEISILPAISGG